MTRRKAARQLHHWSLALSRFSRSFLNAEAAEAQRSQRRGNVSEEWSAGAVGSFRSGSGGDSNRRIHRAVVARFVPVIGAINARVVEIDLFVQGTADQDVVDPRVKIGGFPVLRPGISGVVVQR